ncbi:MAG: response regulator, partial [Deltaproteobacteria bacterium]|nr:response regulator [Deltaproteobacteria bacterium]
MNKKLLIVEDDEALLKILQLLLENSYDITVTMNGKQGLEVLKDTKPDLIVVMFIVKASACSTLGWVVSFRQIAPHALRLQVNHEERLRAPEARRFVGFHYVNQCPRAAAGDGESDDRFKDRNRGHRPGISGLGARGEDAPECGAGPVGPAPAGRPAGNLTAERRVL